MVSAPNGVPQQEVHHAAPRCLVPLHERANGSTELDGEGIQAWLEWEMEAMRWRVPVEMERADLEALVASSEAVLERGKHRWAGAEEQPAPPELLPRGRRQGVGHHRG